MIPSRSSSSRHVSGARGAAVARLAVALFAVAIVAGGGYGAWYLFLRPAAPAAVGAPTPVAPSSASPSGTAPTGTSATPGAAASGIAGDLAGRWTVDPSVGSFADFSGTFVGYRIREELAGVGAQEAVGRTPAVSGTLTPRRDVAEHGRDHGGPVLARERRRSP
ncbi:MAG TPA: hypothetical protein VH813_04850 [Candidatus Limnocylindrales bacterium]